MKIGEKLTELRALEGEQILEIIGQISVLSLRMRVTFLSLIFFSYMETLLIMTYLNFC